MASGGVDNDNMSRFYLGSSLAAIHSKNKWLLTTYENLPILVGCIVAGMIPWFMHNYKVPDKYLRYCSLLGAGLLAGVAIADIIPEGAENIFNVTTYTRKIPSKAQLVGSSILAGFFLIMLSDRLLGSHIQKGSNIGIGLIIHAASDGVVLAASNWTGNGTLQVVVFLGIFFHKMPVSFGLTSTIILQEGMTKWKCLFILFVFALAAPLGSYITLGILAAMNAKSTGIAPGVLLLVSAGTMLYAALCHIIPEVFAASDHGHSHGSGIEDDESDETGLLGSTSTKHNRWDKFVEVGILTFGLAMPLVLIFAIPGDTK